MSLAVVYPEERWNIARRQVVYPPLIVGAVAIFLAVAVTALLARRLVRPLDALRRQAAAIEHGDFRPMTLSRRNDEIQDLAKSINHMVERLARYEADVRQGRAIADARPTRRGDRAHQMRNAATGRCGCFDLHRQACPLEPGCEELQVALRRQFMLMESYFGAVPHAGSTAESAEHAAIGFGRGSWSKRCRWCGRTATTRGSSCNSSGLRSQSGSSATRRASCNCSST